MRQRNFFWNGAGYISKPCAGPTIAGKNSPPGPLRFLVTFVSGRCLSRHRNGKEPDNGGRGTAYGIPGPANHADDEGKLKMKDQSLSPSSDPNRQYHSLTLPSSSYLHSCSPLFSPLAHAIGLPTHSQQSYMHELAKTLPPPRRQNVACDACRSVFNLLSPFNLITHTSFLSKVSQGQMHPSARPEQGWFLPQTSP